ELARGRPPEPRGPPGKGGDAARYRVGAHAARVADARTVNRRHGAAAADDFPAHGPAVPPAHAHAAQRYGDADEHGIVAAGTRAGAVGAPRAVQPRSAEGTVSQGRFPASGYGTGLPGDDQYRTGAGGFPGAAKQAGTRGPAGRSGEPRNRGAAAQRCGTVPGTPDAVFRQRAAGQFGEAGGTRPAVLLLSDRPLPQPGGGTGGFHQERRIAAGRKDDSDSHPGRVRQGNRAAGEVACGTDDRLLSSVGMGLRPAKFHEKLSGRRLADEILWGRLVTGW